MWRGTDVQFYCEDCGTLCCVCHKPVGQNFMELFDKRFHEECVNCVKCGKNLADEDITELDGMPCCVPCFEAQ